ncbi:hypothetical protein [Methanobrevibacter sp.]|nr:hypothetical protein [Methanobrevibacter sp.]
MNFVPKEKSKATINKLLEKRRMEREEEMDKKRKNSSLINDE